MTKDELGRAVLVGSYLKGVSVGPVQLNPHYVWDVVPRQELREVADELALHGLVEPTEVDVGAIPEHVEWQCPWKITSKGLDILGKRGIGAPMPLEFSILDFNFNINIATGGSTVVHTATVSTNQITTVFEHIVQQIDNSKVTEEEKKEAKSKLQEFLKHPLVTALFGAVVGGVTKGLTS